MMVPPEVLDEIRSRVDLVELIGTYVPLKRAGERWKGLCPFHQEKTPSFTVNPKLGIFHCFGCHAGGDAFEFLKRHDRLDFPETVRLLAERTGVPLPTREGPRAEPGSRDALYRLLDWAAGRYERWLWEREDAERARRYLVERGIDTEVARRFRLGHAPEGWDHLLGAAKAEGFGTEALLGAGLVLARQTGTGHYDRFRGRLVFPIADPHPALVVEGYIDCLMAHQHGFTETVAVLGTALTVHHLGILRRYADEVVLFFDADRAGAEAARRAEELLEQSADPHWWALDRKPATFTRGGLRLKVATLTAGHDPDTFLRQEGPAAFEARRAAARNPLLYALDRLFG